MKNASELPKEDFMYDRVDSNFLVEVNMLLHFVKLAHGRLQENQSNHRVCETFIILKNLINSHLPSLNEKVITSHQSQEDIDKIFENNRKMMAEAVKEELNKKLKEPTA